MPQQPLSADTVANTLAVDKSRMVVMPCPFYPKHSASSGRRLLGRALSGNPYAASDYDHTTPESYTATPTAVPVLLLSKDGIFNQPATKTAEGCRSSPPLWHFDKVMKRREMQLQNRLGRLIIDVQLAQPVQPTQLAQDHICMLSQLGSLKGSRLTGAVQCHRLPTFSFQEHPACDSALSGCRFTPTQTSLRSAQ